MPEYTIQIEDGIYKSLSEIADKFGVTPQQVVELFFGKTIDESGLEEIKKFMEKMGRLPPWSEGEDAVTKFFSDKLDQPYVREIINSGEAFFSIIEKNPKKQDN